MKEIKKSYLSVIWFALWGWVLLFIPTIVRFLKIKTRKYYYDDKNIYVQKGVFRKQYSSFPLIKIENIHTTSNILGNGTIKLSVSARGNYPHLKDLEFVKGALNVQNELNEAIEIARKQHGVKAVDTF